MKASAFFINTTRGEIVDERALVHALTDGTIADIKVCKAVGSGYPLMLDATWSYDDPTAVRVGRVIEEDIEVDAGGLVHASTGPGLGVEIDVELIERNTQTVLTSGTALDAATGTSTMIALEMFCL